MKISLPNQISSKDCSKIREQYLRIRSPNMPVIGIPIDINACAGLISYMHYAINNPSNITIPNDAHKLA